MYFREDDLKEAFENLADECYEIKVAALKLGYVSQEEREEMPKSEFAIPEEKKYPIHDIAHARNALARVAQFGTPEERERVRRAVYRKYPELKESFEEKAGVSPLSKKVIKKPRLGQVTGQPSEAKSPRYKEIHQKAIRGAPTEKEKQSQFGQGLGLRRQAPLGAALRRRATVPAPGFAVRHPTAVTAGAGALGALIGGGAGYTLGQLVPSGSEIGAGIGATLGAILGAALGSAGAERAEEAYSRQLLDYLMKSSALRKKAGLSKEAVGIKEWIKKPFVEPGPVRKFVQAIKGKGLAEARKEYEAAHKAYQRAVEQAKAKLPKPAPGEPPPKIEVPKHITERLGKARAKYYKQLGKVWGARAAVPATVGGIAGYRAYTGGGAVPPSPKGYYGAYYGATPEAVTRYRRREAVGARAGRAAGIAAGALVPYAKLRGLSRVLWLGPGMLAGGYIGGKLGKIVGAKVAPIGVKAKKETLPYVSPTRTRNIALAAAAKTRAGEGPALPVIAARPTVMITR